MWEHRQALARLRERGATEVDESGLFRMIEQMRTISETAQKTTKRTRRERQRRTQTGTTTTRPTPPVPEPPSGWPRPRAVAPAPAPTSTR